MSMISLRCDRLEAAHHEAGHAMMAAVGNLTPSLLLVYPDGQRWSGTCYFKSAVQADDRTIAEIAVAGVLAQAKYAGELALQAQSFVAFSAESNMQALTDFFLEEPLSSRSCTVILSTCDNQTSISVDLAGAYSLQDYQKMMTVIRNDNNRDQPWIHEVIQSCISCLDDQTNWNLLKQLATAIALKTPKCVLMVEQNELERATGICQRPQS